MEYAGALGTIIFDESCHLCDLTEAQVGRNQFAMDVTVDRLDREADHAAERISMLEDKMADMEQGLNGLLALGREQTETSTRTAWGLGQLAVIRAGLWSASLGLAFNPNDHASHYLVWFPLDSNPQPGFSALSGILGWSAGVWVSMGAGHVMAYVAIGLR